MRKAIDKIIEIMCTLIMGYMVLAVCWQVITRFVLKNPSTTTEEILRYLLVWTTMVGGAYAYGRRKHLSINMLTKKLSPRGQKILDIGVQLVVIAFCVVVMILGDLAPCRDHLQPDLVGPASAHALCLCQHLGRRRADRVLCRHLHPGRPEGDPPGRG